MSVLETAKLKPGFAVIRCEDQRLSEHVIIPDRVDLRQGVGKVVNCNNCDVEAGDRVIFERGKGSHFEDDTNHDLVLIKNEHILAVVA